MLLIITGPTASGKTYVAEKIATKVQGEIIAADSRTLYSDLRIGTGGYSNSEIIPYHLTGILEIGKKYSAYNWVKRARTISEEVSFRDKIPIICGGTLHYIELFLKGINSVPRPDRDLRADLKRLAFENGRSDVHDILKDLDPDLSEKVHPNNLERVIRYIERAKGFDRIEAIPPYGKEHAIFFILPNKEIMSMNIEARISEMFEFGWIDEVKGLQELGHTKSTPGLDSIGYENIFSLIDGKLTYEQARTNIIKETLEYSRKQIKWMKRFDPTIFRIDREADLDDTVNKILKFIDKSCKFRRSPF